MKIINLTVTSLLLLFSWTVQATQIDEKPPVNCVLTVFMQCEMDAECIRVSPEAINAARFLDINFKNQRIEARLMIDAEPRVTRYERSELMGDLLVLQGAEGELQERSGGLGYTLTLNTTTGYLTMSASGDRVALVVYGICQGIVD